MVAELAAWKRFCTKEDVRLSLMYSMSEDSIYGLGQKNNSVYMDS